MSLCKVSPFPFNRPTIATDPSGLQEEENFAGLDITDALKTTIKNVRIEFNKLSVADRVDLALGLYSLRYYKGTNQTLASISWDIEEFFATEINPPGPWVDGKHGKGDNKIYVTVNGETHFAGAVNYVLWGAVNREIYEMLYNDKNVPSRVWWSYVPSATLFNYGLNVGFDGRPCQPLFLQIDGLIVPEYSLTQAITVMRAYRVAGFVGPLMTRRGKPLKELGISERAAWTRAGWYDDFSKASAVKRDNEATPSSKKYTGSAFTVRIIGETKTWYLKHVGGTVTSTIKANAGTTMFPSK